MSKYLKKKKRKGGKERLKRNAMIAKEALLFVPYKILGNKFGLSDEHIRLILIAYYGKNLFDLMRKCKKVIVRSIVSRKERKEMIRQTRRRYYVANKVRLIKENTEWIKNNRERFRELWRNYYYRTIKARSIYHKKYYKKNRTKIINRSKKWIKVNPTHCKKRSNKIIN